MSSLGEKADAPPPPAKRAKIAMAAARVVLQVKKLSANAIIPVRQSPQAAGYDLCRSVVVVVRSVLSVVEILSYPCALPPGRWPPHSR